MPTERVLYYVSFVAQRVNSAGIASKRKTTRVPDWIKNERCSSLRYNEIGNEACVAAAANRVVAVEQQC
jgi:hypothetical protein